MKRQQIDRMIVRAAKAWGLRDWSIAWQWGKAEYGGAMNFSPTEKWIKITLDKDYIKSWDKERIFRLILHEVGVHPVLNPISRGISDWADHHIKDKKARATFMEQLNTRENEVGDYIITKVMGY